MSVVTLVKTHAHTNADPGDVLPEHSLTVLLASGILKANGAVIKKIHPPECLLGNGVNIFQTRIEHTRR